MDLFKKLAKANEEQESDHEVELTNVESAQIPTELPILPLRGMVVYPLTVLPLNVGQARSLRLVDDVATTSARLVGLVTIKNDKFEDAGPADVYQVGTVAVIHRML